MYLKNIKLKNIKGFSSLNLDFERPNGNFAGWNVIVGDNSSGKSTLLKAIAMGLSGNSEEGILSPESWVRLGTDEAKVDLELSLDPQIDELETKVDLGKADIDIKKGFKISKPKDRQTKTSYYITSKSFDNITSTQKGWIGIGYGPVRRLGAKSPASKLLSNDFNDKFGTLFDEMASLQQVDNWLKDLDYRNAKYSDSVSGKKLECIINILNDGLLPNKFKVVDLNPDGLWLTDTYGLKLSWDQLSDGYQSSIALVCDILRNLYLYSKEDTPILEKTDGKVSCVAAGIVLIDEVDLHLHPEWQKSIGYWFKARFPNIQFIVTTHSPLVCQAADERGIYHLPDPEKGGQAKRLSKVEYDQIVHAQSDRILTSEIFGLDNTFSDEMITIRKEFAALESKIIAGVSINQAEKTKYLSLKKQVQL